MRNSALLFTSLLIIAPSYSTSKPIHFDVPLKTLTLKDKSPDTTPSPRKNFLINFRSGIEAERRARKEIAEEAKILRRYEEEDAGNIDVAPDNDFFESSKWAEMSNEKYDTYKQDQRDTIAAAFEKGFESSSKKLQAETELAMENESKKLFPRKSNAYQFVGVVQPNKKVKWYARPKSENANWSVRVLHVDKAAILRDLFVRGKIDVYGEYANKGLPPAPPAPVKKSKKGEEQELVIPKVPVVEATYSVKERSWKNAWNFSPKAFFTDRSGMYWRQRRLAPGIYTDGEKVYETSYHYSEGRNGMRRVSDNLEEYMNRHGYSNKEDLLNRVKGASKPDLVLEY